MMRTRWVAVVLSLCWLTATAQAQDAPTIQALQAEHARLEAEVARYRQLANDQLGLQTASVTDSLEDAPCDGAAGDGGGCYEPPCVNWFDPCCQNRTLSVFFAGDAWRDFSEIDWSSNFGGRIGADLTWAMGDRGVRGHVGASYGAYDLHGRLTQNQSSTQQQFFLSTGLYHWASGLGSDRWTWAVNYDYLNDNHYGVAAESVRFHQIRFLGGRRVSPFNEFGVWGGFGLAGSYTDNFIPAKVQNQLNLYWRHFYEFGGQTMLYAGMAQPAVAITGNALTEGVVGLRGIAPLTNNWGLIGGVHYVIPSASGGQPIGGFPPSSLEENWNVTFGVIWVPGCGCSLPVLPVADNGWLGKRFVAPDGGGEEPG